MVEVNVPFQRRRSSPPHAPFRRSCGWLQRSDTALPGPSRRVREPRRGLAGHERPSPRGRRLRRGDPPHVQFLAAHRALTYYGRGVSWKFIGDLDRAAADYGQALAINPRFSPAHEELGILASLRQDFDATIAHLSRAIKLSPRRASHYKTRGLAYFDRGSFADAETDLRYAINIADDPYALLFWYLASLKIGSDAAVRAAARTADDCAEAEFYIGEWHLHARRRTEAIAALQVAAKSCPRWFMEHTAAVMELKRQRAVGAAENVEESPSSAR